MVDDVQLQQQPLFIDSTFPRRYFYTHKQKELKLSVLQFFFPHCGFLSGSGGNRGVEALTSKHWLSKVLPSRGTGWIVDFSFRILPSSWVTFSELPLWFSSASKASFYLLFFSPSGFLSIITVFQHLFLLSVLILHFRFRLTTSVLVSRTLRSTTWWSSTATPASSSRCCTRSACWPRWRGGPCRTPTRSPPAPPPNTAPRAPTAPTSPPPRR